MPLIKNEVLIDADIETVYAMAREVETFPQYMPDIESVVVLERSVDGSRKRFFMGIRPTPKRLRECARLSEEGTAFAKPC